MVEVYACQWNPLNRYLRAFPNGRGHQKFYVSKLYSNLQLSLVAFGEAEQGWVGKTDLLCTAKYDEQRHGIHGAFECTYF